MGALKNAIQLYPANQRVYANLMRRYHGDDWAEYVRYNASLPICDKHHQTMLLVGLFPNMSYCLKNVSTLHIITEHDWKGGQTHIFDDDHKPEWITNTTNENMSFLCFSNLILNKN
jgi:hypothetical protein